MESSFVIRGNICQSGSIFKLELHERAERAVYLGLDEKNISAKFVAGRRII